MAETPRRAGLLARALGAVVLLAATLALVEIGALLLVRAGGLTSPAPHRGETGFWWHQHPEYGAWHRPDAEGEHTSACTKVRYRTNSVGARDVERPRSWSGPRVAVLGDSFLEGYNLSERSRLSNLLEQSTGVPHLNFAMASFGPYQQVLVYRDLALRFDHTAVLASVLPANDFAELDLPLAMRLGEPEYAYRPYLVEADLGGSTHGQGTGGSSAPPGFRRHDHREPALQHFLRLHSYAFNAVSSAWRAQGGRGLGRGSFFYEFGEHQLRLLEASLSMLRQAAGERPVVVLLIPTLADLERWAKAGPDRLSERLGPIAAQRGIHLLNLLPLMGQHDRTWSAYYIACDYHWSHYGNRVAAQIVEREVGPLLYPAAAR